MEVAAYGQRQDGKAQTRVQEDFVRLKAIFARAAREDNYLLVYVG